MSNSPCSICLVEKIADPANLDGCSHTYCFKCIINWADRSNTCPACKSKFHKITRKKNGKVTEVEEREQGTNYTIEDAENDYGESASEESEYGAAHPFIDEEAESGDETSEDEVEAQKECNTWAGYLNCEDERFEKRSSEEEDEARSDEDYAHMDNSDYDYDDFVVADDDVSMLTDASSFSSERGRVKRRRLKRARSASSSSSSEIHISVEEEESIDEDQPRRKRRRIDDDLPDPVQQEKVEAINHSPPLVESGGIKEVPSTVVADSDIMDTKEVTIEPEPADVKPADPKPVVAVETTAEKTIEVRTKKRKRSKRKDAQQVTSSDSVPASQCTQVSAKSEGVAEIQVEGNTKNPMSSSVASPKQNDEQPVTRLIENKPKLPIANNVMAGGETKKKKKNKKKKNKPNAEILPPQSTNGASSRVSTLPAPPVVQSTSSDAANATVPQKKKKNKKKKNRLNSEMSLSQGTNGTSSQVPSLPTPVVQPTSASSADTTQTALPKKKKKNKKKKNRPSVGASLSQSTNGTSSQVSSLPPKPSVLQSTNSNTTVMASVTKKKKKNKKKNGLTATNTIVAQEVSNPRVPFEVAPSKSVVQNISHGHTDIKKEYKVEQKGGDKLQHKSEVQTKVEPTHTMVHHQKNQADSNNDNMRNKRQKKSKKNKPSSGGAVNGGTSESVRLSFEEKRSAEERYQRLKNLIAQM